MFLSKRNGIDYLWYEDGQGHRHKISTRQKPKPAALAFLQAFRITQPPTVENDSCTLTEYCLSLREYLVATHRPATVEIYLLLRVRENHRFFSINDDPPRKRLNVVEDKVRFRSVDCESSRPVRLDVHVQKHP